MRPSIQSKQTPSGQIPSAIKCIDCNQVKNRNAFNERSIRTLVEKIKAKKIDPRFTAVVSCIGCSPRQVTELECSACNKVKGLDKFTKTQRRERDNAMCMACIKIQVNTAPAGEGSDEEDDSSSDSEDSDAYYSGDEGTSTNWTGTATATASSVRGPVPGGTLWAGRSATATSAASIPQATTIQSNNATIRPSVAGSVASSAAGGVVLPVAARLAAVPEVRQGPTEHDWTYAESDSDYESDSEEEGAWMDRTSTILPFDMQINLE